MYTFFGAVAASPIDLSKCSQWFNAPGGIMYTFLGALAAMSIDLFNGSGHAAAGTRSQCDALGRTAAGTRHQCEGRGRADGAYQYQCDAHGRAAAAMSIDLSRCSHMLKA